MKQSLPLHHNGFVYRCLQHAAAPFSLWLICLLSARLGQRAQGGKWAPCQGVQDLAAICHQTPTPQKHTQLMPCASGVGFNCAIHLHVNIFFKTVVFVTMSITHNVTGWCLSSWSEKCSLFWNKIWVSICTRVWLLLQTLFCISNVKYCAAFSPSPGVFLSWKLFHIEKKCRSGNVLQCAFYTVWWV